MLMPPLQLRRSFYERIEVEADLSHKPGEGSASVETEISLQSDKSGKTWFLALTIRALPAAEESPSPYRIHLRCVGIFEMAEPQKTPEAARLAGVTGASILYSAAREYLELVTSRSAWGAFRLPTRTFADLSFEKQEGAPRTSREGKTDRKEVRAKPETGARRKRRSRKS